MFARFLRTKSCFQAWSLHLVKHPLLHLPSAAHIKLALANSFKAFDWYQLCAVRAACMRVCDSAVVEAEMLLTAPLNPGTERLLRLRASSLCSEPGPDTSTSERLGSGADRGKSEKNEHLSRD